MSEAGPGHAERVMWLRLARTEGLGAVGFALFLRVRRRGTSLLADASRERASSTAGGAKPRAEPPCSDTRVEMT